MFRKKLISGLCILKYDRTECTLFFLYKLKYLQQKNQISQSSNITVLRRGRGMDTHDET